MISIFGLRDALLVMDDVAGEYISGQDTDRGKKRCVKDLFLSTWGIVTAEHRFFMLREGIRDKKNLY